MLMGDMYLVGVTLGWINLNVGISRLSTTNDPGNEPTKPETAQRPGCHNFTKLLVATLSDVQNEMK